LQGEDTADIIELLYENALAYNAAAIPSGLTEAGCGQLLESALQSLQPASHRKVPERLRSRSVAVSGNQERISPVISRLRAADVSVTESTAAEPDVILLSEHLARSDSWEAANEHGVASDATLVKTRLTETELPVIDLDTAPPRIQRLANRVTAHGLELSVMDGTTDLCVPAVIAILVDRVSRPAVTVAASAGPDATAVLESALEEVVQTRLAGIYQLEQTDRSPAAVTLQEISSYEDRRLFWSVQDRISDLEFWIESHRETTVDEFSASDLHASDIVAQVMRPATTATAST